MKVLMLGWEFPPFISGGLGTACYGLTKAMSEIGTEIIFVLPKPVRSQMASHVQLVSPATLAGVLSYRLGELGRVTFHAVSAAGDLQVYQTPEAYEQLRREQRLAAVRGVRQGAASIPGAVDAPADLSAGAHYNGDMFAEIGRYAEMAAQLAAVETFDVIHAHDWMTYKAGIAAAKLSGKPLVVHVHSTEFDRSGEHVNQRIYDIEREGMHAATRVIAVSFLTKNVVVSRYAVPAEKVEVVYNAIDLNGGYQPNHIQPIRSDEKIVLFLGRITMQKGPEYFVAAAKKVLEVMPNVRFIMAGSGDMIRQTIEMAAGMGIGHRMLFTGFLRGADVERVFRMADLYVMPSVSEPFGIAPLEALSNEVPVIISKQSGVSEVLDHVLKVDFWDVNEMANKIIAVLRHAPLHKTLREQGKIEVCKLSWTDSARQCVDVYERAMAAAAKA